MENQDQKYKLLYLMQELFGTVYLAIVNEGREVACLSLTQSMQKLSVGYPDTMYCATCPASPLWNTILSARYMSALEDHFPGLQQGAAAQQHNQIAGALGQMAD